MDSTLTMIVAALLVGLAKGGLGGAPVALVAPLLSTTMPVSQAVGLILPLLIIADMFALRAYWRKWDIDIVRLMLPMAVVGIVMGIALLTILPDGVLRVLLGIFTLVAAGYKLASDSLTSLTYVPHRWHGRFAGWASGFASALANAGGPPFTAYLLLQKVSPTTFVGTMTLFFAVINLLKLPGFLTVNVLDVQQLLGIAWVIPLIPVGVWLGKRLITWLPPLVFERLMLALLAWAGLSLLFG